MEFNFYSYMADFEKKVIASGVALGLIGKQERVSIRNGKLCHRKFGKFMGAVALPKETCLVVDYYGLMKKSCGFCKMVEELRKDFKGQQLKSVEVVVVHFASIRIETVAELAQDLVRDFPTFKRHVLALRGFSSK